MRIVRRMGLAGVPAVALTQRDLRRLASSGSGLAGIGCSTCGGDSKDVNIASEVARRLGSPELAAAMRDGKRSSILHDAALLASATDHATKFATDRFAVLSGITSAGFADAVRGLERKLAPKQGDTAFVGALVLVFMAGAMDDAAGARSPLATDYRKALIQLQEALRAAGATRLAGLGLTAAATAGQNLAPVEIGRQEGAGFGDGGRPVVGANGSRAPLGVRSTGGWNDAKRFWPAPRKVDTSDLGARDRLPDALDFVPFDATIGVLDSVVGEVARTTRSVSAIRAWKPAPSGDLIVRAANTAAAWIIRNATDSELASAWGAGQQGLSIDKSSDYFRGWIAWGALSERYGSEFSQLGNVKTDPAKRPAFHRYAAKMLALGAKQAVARTGQFGSYDASGFWRPGTTGAEQVPVGEAAQKYVGAWSMLNTTVKPRPESIFFAQVQYQRVYRKEPTIQALNWFGSFGYGMGRFALYFGMRDIGKDDLATYASRIATTEGVRMAGGDVPPEAAQNNTNWFLTIFNVMGPGLSAVLEAINAGVEAAVNAMCATFRVLFGPDIGGVLCVIIGGLLKLVGGGVVASVGAIGNLGKAITGMIGYAVAGNWMKAIEAFFVGVNTAVFFVIGGPFASMLGVPLTKGKELPESSVDYIPSLERLGEQMTAKNPLFLVMLTINTIAMILTPTAASVGLTLLTVSPVIGMLLTPPIRKAIAASRDPKVAPFKALPAAAVQRSVEALTKLLVGLVIGVLNLGDAMDKIGKRLSAWVEKEGGALYATVDALQFFLTNLSSRLTNLVFDVVQMMSNKDGFEMKALLDDVYGLLIEFAMLLPAFATETGEFDAESMKAVNLVSSVGASSVQQGYTAYNEIVRNLGVEARRELAAKVAADAVTAGGGAGLPVVKTAPAAPAFGMLAIAAAAGFTVAVMFSGSGGRRGA